jgi:hypothetical protein
MKRNTKSWDRDDIYAIESFFAVMMVTQMSSSSCYILRIPNTFVFQFKILLIKIFKSIDEAFSKWN